MLVKLVKNKKGFTLIELVVVMVLIAALALVIIPKYASKVDDGNIASTKANIDMIRNAVALYQADNNGSLPNASLTSLVPNYLRAIPTEAVTPASTVVNTNSNAGGWVFNTTTGDVSVNKTGNDANGVAYSTY